MRICYFIQCHKVSEQVVWLISLLNDKNNTFVLSVDGDNEFFAELSYQLRNLDNIIIYRSAPVTWCGISSVQACLEGIRQATHKFNWDYFVNLSGQCFPIKKQSDIREALSRSYKDEKLVFMNHFRPRKIDIPDYAYDSDGEEALVQISLFESNGMACKVHPKIKGMFEHWRTSPVVLPYLRPLVWTEEYSSTKTITVRPLTAAQREHRSKVFEKSAFLCGRAWFIFHRKVCEWILDSENTESYLQEYSSIFCPDESFFQSFIVNSSFWTKNIENNNYRLSGGAPVLVDDSNFQSVCQENVFFGRKLEFHQANKTVSWLESLNV